MSDIPYDELREPEEKPMDKCEWCGDPIRPGSLYIRASQKHLGCAIGHIVNRASSKIEEGRLGDADERHDVIGEAVRAAYALAAEVEVME